jgi:hypothetical protein
VSINISLDNTPSQTPVACCCESGQVHIREGLAESLKLIHLPVFVTLLVVVVLEVGGVVRVEFGLALMVEVRVNIDCLGSNT